MVQSGAIQNLWGQNLWAWIMSGGFAMYPLLLCSLAVWAVIFERLWSLRNLGVELKSFHLEAVNTLLTGEREAVMNLCQRNSRNPTARLLVVALERLSARDLRVRSRWAEAIERRRQVLNQELRRNLWILGTIGSAAPFIGLFGTVVGILRSFQDMAKTGSGGFAVVASGISESLIATAAGIVVAVIAVMAFNAFQTRWNALVLTIRLQTEELIEILENTSWVESAETPARSSSDHGA
jgi:biopolymer transport protein ExbB